VRRQAGATAYRAAPAVQGRRLVCERLRFKKLSARVGSSFIRGQAGFFRKDFHRIQAGCLQRELGGRKRASLDAVEHAEYFEFESLAAQSGIARLDQNGLYLALKKEGTVLSNLS
jgi:hypothetical protein